VYLDQKYQLFRGEELLVCYVYIQEHATKTLECASILL